MKPPAKPRTMYRLRAGEQDEQDGRSRITAYPFLLPERRDQQEKWVAERAYDYDSGALDPETGAKLGPGRHQRVLIQLASNVLQHTLQAHRECRTGKKPFCAAAHVGQEAGIATRLAKSGSYYYTECEPSKCALFLNGEEPRSRAQEIFKDWAEVYPYAGLDTRAWDKDSKSKVPAGATCRPLVWFLFHLVDPEDHSRLLHPPTEFCHFQTRSHVNLSLFEKKLTEVWYATGGRPSGFRLWMIYQGFENQFGRWVHAWNLETPNEDFAQQVRAAAERRKLPDYEELAGGESRELAVISEERLTTDLASNPGVEPGTEMDRAYAYEVFRNRVTHEEAGLVTDHPVVQGFAKRLRVSYALFTKWPATYDDPYWIIRPLVDECVAKGIPYADLLRGTDFEGMIVLPAARAPEVPAAEVTPEAPPTPPEPEPEAPSEPDDLTADVRGGSGVIDAEFTEVPDGDSAGDRPDMPGGPVDGGAQRTGEPVSEFKVPTDEEVRAYNEKKWGLFR